MRLIGSIRRLPLSARKRDRWGIHLFYAQFRQEFTLSPAVEKHLQRTVKRHDEIMEKIHSAGHASSTLGKELSRLSTTVKVFRERCALDEEKLSILDLLEQAKKSNDKELELECQSELDRIDRDWAKLEYQLLEAALPQDENDLGSDAIIEIRAGTGGDEAALFAGELLDCYTKTARSLHWKVEALEMSRTELGGVREASLSVSGVASWSVSTGGIARDLAPYGVFKFESGVHRVQRVPINDVKIHTSACSVAVLPFISQESSDASPLPMSELRIETMRATGSGGQHVNTTDSAVRITHIPTGITASIQDERSQHKNKDKALRLIAARVHDQRRAEEERARGQMKSSLMGGGDRSERIRTYNFPQDRVTDHRSKETRHGIETLLKGDLGSSLVVSFLDQLKALQREEQLKQLDEDTD